MAQGVKWLFHSGKPKDPWQGVKTMGGLHSNSSFPRNPAEVCVNVAEDLNNFYSTFDHCDYTQEREELSAELIHQLQSAENLQLSPMDVERTLEQLKPNRAPVPDQLRWHVLMVCCS